MKQKFQNQRTPTSSGIHPDGVGFKMNIELLGHENPRYQATGLRNIPRVVTGPDDIKRAIAAVEPLVDSGRTFDVKEGTETKQVPLSGVAKETLARLEQLGGIKKK